MQIQISDPLALARQLAQAISLRADAADKNGVLPAEDVQALRDSGYLALVVPQAFGGAGLGLRDVLAAHLELAQGSASTALVAAMTLQMIGHAREIEQYSAESFARLCRLVVEERALINTAASEPQLGSPSRGQFFETRATRTAEGYQIDGHKTWITGGQHLTHILVKLMLDDQPAEILIKNPSAGLRWEETWRDALALRASDSHDLYLEGVRVGAEALLEKNPQPPQPSHPNAWFPMTIAAVYLGSGLAARDAVIRYTLERIPTALGQPIATLPKIQRQIGEMDISLQAARALLLEVAAAWDAQPEQRPALYPRIAAAKHYAVEAAISVTDIALKIAGGQGITNALPLERYFRDVRAGSMQPPSGDTALEIVGRGAIADYEGAEG